MGILAGAKQLATQKNNSADLDITFKPVLALIPSGDKCTLSTT